MSRPVLMIVNLATATCLGATLVVELIPVIQTTRAVPAVTRPAAPAEFIRPDVRTVQDAFPELVRLPAAPAATLSPQSLRYQDLTYAHWRERLLLETHPTARLEAVQAIATLGANGQGAAAARDLLAVLRTSPVPTGEPSPESNLVRALQEGLARIGPEAAPALMETLRDPAAPDACRESCAGILAATGHGAPQWVPQLLDWLPQADTRSQQLARIALRGDTPVPPAIISTLADELRKPDVARRLRVLEVLREVGPGTRTITPVLLQQLADSSPEVRETTVAVLETSGFFLAYNAGELADYDLTPVTVHDPELLPGYRSALDLAERNSLQEPSTLAVLKLIGRLGSVARESAANIAPLASPSQPEAIRTAAKAALNGLQ